MTVQYEDRGPIAFDPTPFRDNNGALRILIVHKKSRLELQQQESSVAGTDVAQQHFHHRNCSETVERVLKELGAQVEHCFRSDLSLERTKGRIVITVGGDGTVLDASHASEDSPVLGVNSDPARSVGSLCVGSESNFESLMHDLWAGKLHIRKSARIGGELNGKPLQKLALNEVLIAHPNPAGMSRYLIRVGDHAEEQKSSGVWISTAIGSTGAILSAGGHMQDLGDDRLQFLVREPYLSVGKTGRIFCGLVASGESIEFVSGMTDGRLFIDGPVRIEPFTTGMRLVLHSRGTSLSLFVSDEMENRRGQIARLREAIHDKIVKEQIESVP